MIKKKNGFISMSVVYSMILVFISIAALLIAHYTHNHLMVDELNKDIQSGLEENLIKPDPVKPDVGPVEEKLPKPGPDKGTDPDGNIRYIGSDPNNYIKFNNELWRIIGLFYNVDNGSGKKETRLKIIKADPAYERANWDISPSNVNDGLGVNEWSQADIKYTLNGNYWNSILKPEAKKYIGSALWYTAASTPYIAPKDLYREEKGNKTGECKNFSNCRYNGDYVSRKTRWIGNVGLLYPSDYGYATAGTEKNPRNKCTDEANLANWAITDCGSTNWLNVHQWYITPYSPRTGGGSEIFISSYGGSVNSGCGSSQAGVYPTVYLKPDLSIIDGIGSRDNPYILEFTKDVKPVDKNGNAVDVIKNEFSSTSGQLAKDDRDGNIRYYGLNPNNYVKFNGETWRIIGVFNTDNGNGKKDLRVKLVRLNSIGSYSWDATPINVNHGNGISEWSKSDIMNLLNNGPYYNRTSGNCIDSNSDRTKPCNFTSTGLTTTSKNMIDTVLWYTAASNYGFKTGDEYNYERGTATTDTCHGTGDDICNDKVARTTRWVGKVGLLYPSDYGYATGGGASINRSTCINNKLLYPDWENSDCAMMNYLNKYTSIWTITPKASPNRRSYSLVIKNGAVNYQYDYITSEILPTVYLKPTVKILKGNGSSESPYELGL